MPSNSLPPLEDHDGFIADLYHLLWLKNSEGDTCPGMLLPDLVLYKYRIPAYWYFTSIDGSLKRKSKTSIVNKKIYADFTKGVSSPSDVVAYHICEQRRDSKMPETSIRYFDSKGLHDFLFHEEKLDDGCLQKFIQPKGAHNTMIQAAWSPQMCLLERRVNVNFLRSARVPILQRTATYDGDEHLSQITPVRGTLLADRIQLLCLAMVKHIKTVSPNRQTISRMLLNFKCDSDDNVWLLWCSSLRLSSETSEISVTDDRSMSSATELKPPASPVCLEVVLKAPSRQAVGKAMDPTRGVCPFTGQKLDQRHQYFVTFKNIIEYSTRLDESLGLLPEQRRSRFEVPLLLERVCHDMTVGKYATSLKSPHFLNRRVLVSEEAYLEFSTPAIPGAKAKPSMLFKSKFSSNSSSAATLPALPPGKGVK